MSKTSFVVGDMVMIKPGGKGSIRRQHLVYKTGVVLSEVLNLHLRASYVVSLQGSLQVSLLQAMGRMVHSDYAFEPGELSLISRKME